MCGIHGLINVTGKGKGHSGFIRDGFLANMLRGTDSSGIALVDTAYSSTEVHKLPVPGMYYTDDRVAAGMIREADKANTVAICHVRHATVGKVNMENAHPFQIESGDDTLVGCHNGTLQSWMSRPSAKGYNSDSMWALSRIAEEGADAFEDIKGAYAFVWWDSRYETVLNMARNKERPMWVALLKDGGMAYASEAGMLYWLLERNDMQVERMFELEVDKLYQFNVDNPHEYTTSNLPAYIPTYTATAGVYGSNSNTNYYLTHVDKVQKLLDSVSKETKQPAVTLKEVKEGRDLGWSGQEVEFVPLEEMKDGSIMGEVDFVGVLTQAVVRNPDPSLPWDAVWHTKVLGVNDTGTSLVYVCANPYKTTAMYSEEEECA